LNWMMLMASHPLAGGRFQGFGFLTGVGDGGGAEAG